MHHFPVSQLKDDMCLIDSFYFHSPAYLYVILSALSSVYTPSFLLWTAQPQDYTIILLFEGFLQDDFVFM